MTAPVTTVWLLASAVLFLLILWQVQTGGVLVRFDGRANAALARLRRRPMLAAGAWISQVGTGAAGVFVGLVATGLLLSDGRRALVAPFWVTLAGAQVTTWSLKFLTKRVRPDFLEGITAASPSFPSAHATVSMASYAYMALVTASGLAGGTGWVYAIAAAVILLICFSRMLLSLHYLSDVIAGAAVGVFWVTLGWRMAAG